MIKGEPGNEENETDIRRYPQKGGGNRPIIHKIPHSSEMRVDVKRGGVNLNTASLNFDVHIGDRMILLGTFQITLSAPYNSERNGASYTNLILLKIGVQLEYQRLLFFFSAEYE